MHPNIIAAWIRDLELPVHTQPDPFLLRTCKRQRPDSRKSPHPRKKARRVVLGERAANDHNIFSPSHESNASRSKKSIEKKRMRTPSPSKRQFPDDAYSPDDEIDDATPRPDRFALSTYPIPDLSLRGVPSQESIEDEDVQACSPTRSHTQSSKRSASPKKTTSLWDVGNGVIYTHLATTTDSQREQLGENGLALLEKLEDINDTPVVPANLKQRLAEANVGKVRQYQFDTSDTRPEDELLWELRIIQDIISLSHRCLVNRDYESEWNNRVHTKVLELALGNDETSVGFRSLTTARITREYRPTHSNNVLTGKMIDYAIHLEPSGPARDNISSFFYTSMESINHIDYEGLYTRPIAVSIETKTESRPVEEAKVQLGVWVAAQVARIEALVRQLDRLRVKKPAAEARPGRPESETGARGRRTGRGRGGRMSQAEQLQTQDPTLSPTAVMAPDPSDILSQIVFPLIDIQSESWSLFFARVTPSSAPHPSRPGIRKPVSHIQIFHSVSLGDTGNIVQTYRLVKSLKVLRDWVDGDFRKWWDEVLGVRQAEGGSQS